MAEPIPDDELRGYSEWGDGPVTDMITGGVCRDADALHHLLILTRLTARDLARELLALRAAARVADNVLLGVELGEVVGEKAAMRARADLRALLPEEPPRA